MALQITTNHEQKRALSHESALWMVIPEKFRTLPVCRQGRIMEEFYYLRVFFFLRLLSQISPPEADARTASQLPS